MAMLPVQHNAYSETACAFTNSKAVQALVNAGVWVRSTRWRVVTRKDAVPKEPGCYAVYHDGRLVYIGSSSFLPRRVNHYFSVKRLRPRITGGAMVKVNSDVLVTVKVAQTSRAGEWLMREYRLIARLRPRDNRHYVGTYVPPVMLGLRRAVIEAKPPRAAHRSLEALAEAL